MLDSDPEVQDKINPFLFHVSFGHIIYPSNRKAVNTELGTRSGVSAVVDLSFKEDIGGVWILKKSWNAQRPMTSYGSLDDKNAERNTDMGGLGMKFQK